MKFSNSSLKVNEEKLFKITSFSVRILIVVCVGVAAYFFIDAGKEVRVKKVALEENRTIFAYEAIATGPMILNPHLFFRSVPSLLQELVFIRTEKAPGIAAHAPFLMGIKNSKQLFSVFAGEDVFLHIDETEPSFPRLTLSEQPTSFSVKPLLAEKEGVLVEAFLGSETESKELNVLIRQQSFAEFDPEALEAFEKKPCVHFLKKAKYWGIDALYQQYSGSVLAPLKDAIKLEIPHENRSLFFLVKEGDILFFEENTWKMCKKENLERSTQKAEVISLKPEGIQMAVWDESGYIRLDFLIPFCSALQEKIKEDFSPTAVRLHSAHKISCLLGKKRVVLKKGDWLLKNGSSWRVLRTSQDIQDCLEHRRKGSLLILDEFEIKGAQVAFMGHFFDPMRTKSQAFQVCADIPKNPKQKKKAAEKVL